MKKQLIVYGLVLLLGGATSCKGKNKNQNTDNTTTTTTTEPTTTAPVVVNEDDELRNGVRDATKDFPNVNATVENGVITLTGSIERSRYPTLKQSLDGLRPKQVVNNLNYK
jgi:osmotically-inducible protein OsmY